MATGVTSLYNAAAALVSWLDVLVMAVRGDISFIPALQRLLWSRPAAMEQQVGQ